MVKYIYKCKEIHYELSENSEFEQVISYTKITPVLLCTVPIRPSDELIFISNNGVIDDIWRINIKAYYPLWDSNTMVVLDNFIKYPIWDSEIIREKNNYELYLDGIYHLRNGEYISDNSILYTSNPYVFGEWNGSAWIENLDKKKLNYSNRIKEIIKPLLTAYDRLAIDKANGVGSISDEDWAEVLEWKNILLELVENVDITKTVEEQIPPTLSIIRSYL